VDGEVIQPWTTKSPALVRVHHVLRGIASEVIQVGGEGAGADCSIALERVGERSRMILNGGPEVFDLFYDQSEARLEDHTTRDVMLYASELIGNAQVQRVVFDDTRTGDEEQPVRRK